jgi:hypothetical protein
MSKMQYKSVDLEIIKASGYQQTISLRDFIDTPCCGIIIMAQRAHSNPLAMPNQFVISGATLCVNGKNLLRYDCCDLHEWNWLKTGLEVPINKEPCALMPFSRSCNEEGHRAVMNFGRAQNVSLKLDLNESLSSIKWKVLVAAFARNLMQYGNNKCALHF